MKNKEQKKRMSQRCQALAAMQGIQGGRETGLVEEMVPVCLL